jgi:hypothetical protein
MPTISERQSPIQMVLLTAEQEMDGFIWRELNNNSDDIEMNSLILSLTLSSEFLTFCLFGGELGQEVGAKAWSWAYS